MSITKYWTQHVLSLLSILLFTILIVSSSAKRRRRHLSFLSPKTCPTKPYIFPQGHYHHHQQQQQHDTLTCQNPRTATILPIRAGSSSSDNNDSNDDDDDDDDSSTDQKHHHRHHHHQQQQQHTPKMNPTIASLIAGSIAGAIGVGVTFPLDTIATASQMRAGRRGSSKTQHNSNSNSNNNNSNMKDIILSIYQTKGLIGFYSGVRGMMIGQAFIKSLAFSANSFAFRFLSGYYYSSSNNGVVILIGAACFAGFATSFFVAPIERIKVMMQASSSGGGGGGDSKTAAAATTACRSEWECVAFLLRTEGWRGLLFRGLYPTLAREVPSYGIYFVVYRVLMQQSYISQSLLGGFASLVNGAISGCASWIPVYPVDVVKTLVQNGDGGGGEGGVSAWSVAVRLFKEGGIGAFFDGLTPKMIRSAVNHGVAFFIYDLVMKYLTL